MPSTADDWQAEQHALLEQLEIAKRQTGKLARLIDELLDVSQIQSGRVHFDLVEVDIAALAREVGERMQHTTQRHQIAVDAPASLVITADRDHLEQVLNNLVGNAIKYSPDGGDIAISVRPDPKGVEVEVRDHGIGIPEEELESVFGLFYRSPDKGARDVGGMGLGLYISRQIVDRHGGRIWGESERREGSSFRVWLPREARLPDSMREEREEPSRAAS
jgi:signal transduction histidine kinase